MATKNQEVTWTFIKGLVDGIGLKVHYTENTDEYSIFAFNGQIIYSTTIFKNSGALLAVENQTQNDADKVDFETNYKTLANTLEKLSVEASFATNQNLDVTVTAEGIDNKLRYDQLTTNQVIANGSYTTIYTYNGSGKWYGGYLKFNTKEMSIKVTVDGVDILVDFDIRDLPEEEEGSSMPFIGRIEDKEVRFTPPKGVSYSTSILIAVKSSKTNKKLSWGYTVLTKET